MADQRIDYSRYTGGMESEGVSQQKHPERQTRPQAEKEKAPDYFQRSQERERGDSSWAGSSMGGGTWAGRSK